MHPHFLAWSCWGRGDSGQLGNGGTSDKTTPTLTSSLGTGRTAVALSTDIFHACAILDNGDVSCWGAGWRGQLGNGGGFQQNSPTLTSSLGTSRTVALSERDFDGDGTYFSKHIPTLTIENLRLPRYPHLRHP